MFKLDQLDGLGENNGRAPAINFEVIHVCQFDELPQFPRIKPVVAWFELHNRGSLFRRLGYHLPDGLKTRTLRNLQHSLRPAHDKLPLRGPSAGLSLRVHCGNPPRVVPGRQLAIRNIPPNHSRDAIPVDHILRLLVRQNLDLAVGHGIQI